MVAMETSIEQGVPVKTCRRGHEVTGSNVASDGKCKTCQQNRWRAKRDGVPMEPIPLSTQCANGHEFTPENTYTHRNVRQCKICRRAHVAKDYETHHAKRVAEKTAWRKANPELHRERARRWLKNNREQANLTSRIKKQRRRAAGTLTVADWKLVLEVYGSACLACGDADKVTIDHVVPISHGGLNTIENVQPLCSYCNTSKGARVVDYRPGLLADLVA
jgi:5-methylcytosine-specific restriction endonuclease McrA